MGINTSHSQLTTAVLCPWAYYVSTRFRDAMTIRSQAQVVGILVHTVIERFYEECPNKDDRFRKGQVAWLTDTVHEEFIKAFGAEALAEVVRYHAEYAEAVEDTMEYGRSIGKDYKAPTWTGYWQRKYGEHFDALEEGTFKPLQAQMKTIVFQSTLLDIYSHIERAINNFLKLYRSDLKKYVQSYIEIKIDPRLEIHGSRKGGRIDLVGVREDGELDVLDFKTGRKRWSREALLNDPQTMTYALGVREQFGKSPTQVGIIDLYNGEIHTRSVSEAEIDAFKAGLKGAIVYEQRLNACIDEKGISATLEEYPLPIGRGAVFCPCNLIHEDNSVIKCPGYVKETSHEIQ